MFLGSKRKIIPNPNILKGFPENLSINKEVNRTLNSLFKIKNIG